MCMDIMRREGDARQAFLDACIKLYELAEGPDVEALDLVDRIMAKAEQKEGD